MTSKEDIDIEQRKWTIANEIKIRKWTKEFKQLCASGLGYRLTGFTKTVALEAVKQLRQDDMIDKARRIIVIQKKTKPGDC